MQHTRGEKGHIRAAAEKRLQKRRSWLSVDPLYMEVTTRLEFCHVGFMRGKAFDRLVARRGE